MGDISQTQRKKGMDDPSIVTFVIEWIWVPAYAALMVIARMLAKLWQRQSEFEQISSRRMALMEQAAANATDQRQQILEHLESHNAGVINAIDAVRDDVRDVDQRHETRFNALEAAIRDK